MREDHKPLKSHHNLFFILPLIVFSLFIIPDAQFAFATAPTYQATVSNSTEAGTSCTVDVNVQASTDLIVTGMISDVAINTISDEDTQTYTLRASHTTSHYSYIHTTTSPSTNAANTITFTTSSSADIRCFAVTYSAVDTGSPIGNTGSNGGASSPASDTITYSTGTNDSDIVHICGNEWSDTYTFDTGKTTQASISDGGANKFGGALATETTTTAGSNDATCSFGKTGVAWSHAVVEVKGVVASAPVYVVDLLDVYESSSTTLGTGTAVCLDVDLEVADSCNSLGSASFNSAKSIVSQSTNALDLEFSHDGTKMFIVDDTNNDIGEWNCTTPWDASTCSEIDTFSVSSQTSTPTGISYRPDGLGFFISHYNPTEAIYEYTCPNAWDLTGCSYTGNSLSITDVTFITGLDWSIDGTKMFLTGSNSGAKIAEYDCDPYLLSSCTFVDNTTFIGRSIEFTNNGDTVYAIDISGVDIESYRCSTSWDASTCTAYESFDISGQGSNPYAVFPSADGNKIFTTDITDDEINEYDLNAPLKVGSTYRFEVEVDNTGTGAGSPTRLDADSVVAAGDIFGSIPVGSLLNSGCSTNTDWTEAISTTEAQFSSGTTCSLAATSGTAEFWFIVTIDPDASDGDTTFSITDGTVSDTSTTTSFDITTPVYVTTLLDVYESASTTLDSGTAVCTDVGVGYDNECQGVTTLSTVDSLNTSGQDNAHTGIVWSHDGTTMILLGSGGDSLDEYTCTAWDASTCTFVDATAIGSPNTLPVGLSSSYDGKKLFTGGWTEGDEINEWECTTAWDASTCTFVDSLDISAQTATPSGQEWNSDGTKFFISTQGNFEVLEYTCDPFDISTCVFIDSLDPTTNFGTRDIDWGNDGTSLYWVATSDVIYHYICAPFDISTCVYTAVGNTATAGDPYAIFLSYDETKIFITNDAEETLREYSINPPLKINTSYRLEYEVTNIGGTSGSPDQTLTLDSVGEPFDITTINYDTSLDVSGQSTGHGYMAWSGNGTLFHLSDLTNDQIDEWSCTTAWDVNSCTYVDNLNVAGQSTAPVGIEWNGDGTKFFMASNELANKDVTEYNCTAYDVSTCSVVDSLNIATESDNPRDITWSRDGKTLFIQDDGDSPDLEDIDEYRCTTAWDVSTCTYTDSFETTSDSLEPRGLIFSKDGLRFFQWTTTDTDVDQYTCTSPWNISTCSFSKSTDISSFSGTSYGAMESNNDGTILYLYDADNTEIDQIIIGGLFGEITATDVTNSGCSTNTNWVDSIANSVDVQTVDGTTCAIASGGSAEYWYIVSPDATATDDDITFQVSDVDGFTGTSADVYFDVTKPLFVFDELDVYESASTTLDSGTGICTDVNFYDGYCASWDIASRSFIDSFSTSGQDNTPTGLFFSPDGTKMFFNGADGSDINEYTCTAWDVSTCSFVDSKSVAEDTAPRGIAFSSDGKTMFVIGTTTPEINEYTCTTAWDVSTCSFVDSTSISTNTSLAIRISTSADGTRFFITDNNDEIDEYSCTAWDASTCSFVDSLDVSSQDTIPSDTTWTPDGTRLFMNGQAGADINEYKCASFDISTCSFVTAYDVSGQDSSPTGIFVSSDGTKLFITGNAGDDINEYDLTALETAKTYRFEVDVTNIGGMSTSADVFSMLSAVDGGYDLDLLQFSGTSSISNGTGTTDINWSNDGGKLMIMSSSNSNMYEYTCSTAYDSTSCTYTDVKDTSGQSTTHRGMDWKPDGTKFFLTANTGDDVDEYSCSTGWDLSTCSFVDDFAGGDTLVRDVLFSNDGTKMYVTADTANTIREYSCTAYDVSTCSFNDATDVSSQTTVPYTLFSSEDGTEFYLGDDKIYIYNGCTAWDFSTCTYDRSIDILANAPMTGVRGGDWNGDGTKIYLSNLNSENKIYEYDTAHLFGSITATDITSSGCSTNTNWTDSIVSTTDIQLDAGTTCTNVVGGTTTYWFIATIDDDAPMIDLSRFSASDGSVTNTSAWVQFSVKAAAVLGTHNITATEVVNVNDVRAVSKETDINATEEVDVEDDTEQVGKEVTISATEEVDVEDDTEDVTKTVSINAIEEVDVEDDTEQVTKTVTLNAVEEVDVEDDTEQVTKTVSINAVEEVDVEDDTEQVEKVIAISAEETVHVLDDQEQVTKTVSINADETVNVLDNELVTKTVSINVSETVNVLDQENVYRTWNIDGTETVHVLDDQEQVTKTVTISADETVHVLDDQEQVTKTVTIAVVEEIDISDVHSIDTAKYINVVEEVDVEDDTEQVTKTVSIGAVEEVDVEDDTEDVTKTVSINAIEEVDVEDDTEDVTKTVTISAGETVHVLDDNEQVTKIVDINASETVHISDDNEQVTKTVTISVSETVNVLDQESVYKSSSINAVEGVDVIDQELIYRIWSVSATEEVDVFDQESVGLQGTHNIFATEQVDVLDQGNLGNVYEIFVTETVNVNDQQNADVYFYQPSGKYIWFKVAPASGGTVGGVYADSCPAGESVTGISDGRVVCSGSDNSILSKSFTLVSTTQGGGDEFIGGYYEWETGGNDFDPPVTFGEATNSYHGHVGFVIGSSAGDELTINVNGTSVTTTGVYTTLDAENVVVPNGSPANSYFETNKFWVGDVTISVESGTPITSNYGYNKYWDYGDSNFTLRGIDVTWLGGANDVTADIKIIHHKATGWVYSAGGTPSFAANVIDSLQTEHGSEAGTRNGVHGAWKETNWNTYINATNNEGLLIEVITGSARSFEAGNILIKVDPD